MNRAIVTIAIATLTTAAFVGSRAADDEVRSTSDAVAKTPTQDPTKPIPWKTGPKSRS